MPKLEVGEKYLYIKVKCLGKDYEDRAFPNKNKKSDKEPAFKGSFTAVWVNKMKADTQQIKEEEI